MRLLTKHLLMFAMLCSSGWTFAQTSPAERLSLTLEDNRSNYTTAGERNNYVNTLRLNQPSGDNKLTAGMLNDGDNYIVFHRIDDQGNDSTFARVNLNAQVTEAEMEVIDGMNFSSNPPSSQTTITQAMLPDNWGTNGSNLIWQTNGYAYISGQGGLTYSVPAGYDNAIIQLVIYVGSNVRNGYFSTNYNDAGWSVNTTQVSAGGGYVVKTFTGVNTGDVISIYGAQASGSSYYLSQSPDIDDIYFREVPKTLAASIEITPTISRWQSNDWGAETSFGNSATYSPNDLIDLYNLGEVSDIFYAETSENAHSDYYNYKVTFGGNIDLPSGGSTGLDFYASADFTAATSSSPTTSTFNGPNNWTFLSANIYSPSAGKCCYILSYGSILYTMPSSFMGNSVNVTMTSSTGTDGAGPMYVNGVLHTFTAGETYTWSVPVSANGTIEFKANAADDYTNSYSIDFTQIVISSGNGSSMNAPAQAISKPMTLKYKNSRLHPNMPEPTSESKHERDNIIRIND